MPFVPDIPTGVYLVALAGAFSLGLSKTGFPGLSIVNVFIMAELFGAKASVGIILPLLVLCDLIVYPLFRKFASWRAVVPLLLPAVAGVFVGWRLLDVISDVAARRTIGGIVLAMLALQFLRQNRPGFLAHLPDSSVFRWISGVGIGIATTLANAAGPIYSIYALVHRMKKEDFLGVGARFFLFINLFKIPFNTDLGIINQRSLLINLALVPGILAGIYVGRRLITRVPQRAFEALLTVFTLAAGVRLAFF